MHKRGRKRKMKKEYKDSKRAVIYCRVSTEEQAKGGESLSSQRQHCCAFAERNGYQVIEKFIEEGESGRTMERTKLKKLLGYCFNKSNNVGAVICLKEDRFSRNVFNYGQLEKALREAGIRLLFVESNNEQSASGKLIRNINNSFAEFESDVNSERTRAGIAEAIAKGRWVWALRGYSFKKNYEGKKQLFPNEDSIHIKKIFNLASKGIYSQIEICKQLNRDGFKISKQALSVLLHNSVYCGLLPDTYNRNNGQYIKGIHEPLISEEQFFTVQRILQGKSRLSIVRLRNNPKFPLKGIIRCSVCGNKLTASISKGKKIYVPYYHCTKGHKPGRVQQKVIEPIFENYLKCLCPDREVVNAFEKCVISTFKERTHEIEQQKKRTEQRIEELEEQKSRIIMLMARDKVGEDDGQKEIAKIKEKIHEQEEISAELATGPDVNKCWTYAKDLLLHLDKAWTNGDLEFKQKLQSLIMPDGFVFEGKIIKPIKNPYFLSMFQPKTGEIMRKGANHFGLQTLSVKFNPRNRLKNLQNYWGELFDNGSKTPLAPANNNLSTKTLAREIELLANLALSQHDCIV